MSTTRSLLLSSSLVALALVACTADATSPGTSSTTPKKSSSTAGTTEDSADPSTPSTSTTTGADTATCAAKPDLDSCLECCAKGDETAFKAADDVYFDCACGASGVCKTECAADLCAGTQNPSKACVDCLDRKATSCDESAAAACQADAKCKAAAACEKSACASKEPQ